MLSIISGISIQNTYNKHYVYQISTQLDLTESDFNKEVKFDKNLFLNYVVYIVFIATADIVDGRAIPRN